MRKRVCACFSSSLRAFGTLLTRAERKCRVMAEDVSQIRTAGSRNGKDIGSNDVSILIYTYLRITKRGIPDGPWFLQDNFNMITGTSELIRHSGIPEASMEGVAFFKPLTRGGIIITSSLTDRVSLIKEMI